MGRPGRRPFHLATVSHCQSRRVIPAARLSRDGYRFAKYEGESFFTISEKPLQIAGF
jgi:hypothetical protein